MLGKDSVDVVEDLRRLLHMTQGELRDLFEALPGCRAQHGIPLGAHRPLQGAGNGERKAGAEGGSDQAWSDGKKCCSKERE